MDAASDNKQEHAGQVTPAFCLQSAAELQLQRKVSHTPKNSPKKSLEQFNNENLPTLEDEDTKNEKKMNDEKTETSSKVESSRVLSDRNSSNSINSDTSSKRADDFVHTPKVQSLIKLIVESKLNALKIKPGVSVQSIISLKEKEIKMGKQKLGKQVHDMIESSNVFNQLKQQPQRLL